jgi:hypothetical protein
LSVQEPPHERLRIIRNRFIIEHLTPFKREVINEVTLLNTGPDNACNVFLYRMSFMPGLEVQDSDGSILPYRPNAHTRVALEELSQRDDFYRRILEDMNNHVTYVVWIDLPEDRPIKPSDSRVIRLRYFDDRNPRVLRWFRSIFSVPRYEVLKVTPADEDYDTHYLIHAPEGFVVKLHRQEAITKTNELERDLTDVDGLHSTKTDRLVSLRLPHLHGETVSLSLEYDILLERAERVFIGAVVYLLLGLSVLLLLLATNVIPPAIFLGKDITALLRTSSSVVGAGTVAANTAILALLTNPLCHRTKVWLFMALMLTVIALAISGLGFPF